MNKCPKCGNTLQFIQFQFKKIWRDVVVDAYGNMKFVKDIYREETEPCKLLECRECGYEDYANKFEVDNE